MQKRGGGPRCSTRPPTTCTPSHRRPPFRLPLVYSPLTATGDGKRTLTLGKGQISHSACLKALGTKAGEFTSIKPALAFVLAEKEDPEWALQQTSPSWGALSGAAKRLSRRPFECCPPATSHARLRAQALTCAHTHSTLPSTFSRVAAHNTPGPHQTESPAAPFEK